MRYRNVRCSRRGATAVEAALVYPVAFLLIIGLLVGAMGIFRYQQVASLAREGARYASTHGGQYAKETGQSAATAEDVYQEAILPKAAGLDPDQMSYQVAWNPDNWPTRAVTDNGAAQGATVSVTVTYQWVPEAYLGGITLSSTSVMPMSY
jgi:Flp pilus assembly protein TadG